MGAQDTFNRGGLSRWVNSPAGRLFRVAAGLVFLGVGWAFHTHALGVLSMLWGVLPLTAGAFDVC
jgi:hypothetical protein